MKIEIDVTKEEAIILLKSLKQILGMTTSKTTFNSISKIMSEIESDALLDDEIYKQLYKHLVHFKHPSAKITKDANLRIQLRLKPLFLNRSDGLKAVCNRVLKTFLLRYKPTASSNGVVLKSVQKCMTVQDVTNLIKTTYEAAK